MSRRNRETDICVSAKQTIEREIYQKKWVQEKKIKGQSWGEDGVGRICIDNFREMLRIVGTKKPFEMCVCVA